MPIEIERKFLVQQALLPNLPEGEQIIQGYIATVDRTTVRVRLNGERAWLTLKGKTTGISRSEFEYPIPAADARKILAELCSGGVVEKIRYRIPQDGLTWELDIFEGKNRGLIIAEIELSDEEQVFSRPAWLGEEVSHDPRYSNLALLHNPYQHWNCHITDTCA